MALTFSARAAGWEGGHVRHDTSVNGKMNIANRRMVGGCYLQLA
jgi:hypothetical protein